MGAVKCEVHGLTGIGLCCEHIRDAILSNQHMHLNSYYYEFLESEVWVCDNCLCEIKIIGDTWDDHIELQPVCGKCASIWEGVNRKRAKNGAN